MAVVFITLAEPDLVVLMLDPDPAPGSGILADAVVEVTPGQEYRGVTFEQLLEHGPGRLEVAD